MTYKKLIINLLFGATFFNHLHALAFIPQHNRPLLLLLFPVFIFYIFRYDLRLKLNLIFWFFSFFFIAFGSTIWNLFFGDIQFYNPELIKRILSYFIIVYFFLIGIIFWNNKNLISNKFYTFIITIGLIQIYSILIFPFSNIFISLFENHFIDSFSSAGDKLLFFEAEPSYVGFLLIFLMIFYEKKNTFVLLIFSILSLSIRTTILSSLYYIKKRPFTYIIIGTTILSLLIVKAEVNYSVFTRLVNVVTFKQVDRSLHVRNVKNKIGLEIIRDYPIFGVGPGQYSVYYTSKYLNHYDLGGSKELKQSLAMKSKVEDPYSFFIGIVSELGILSILWILLTFVIFYRNSNRKYLISILFLILMMGYPFGKPYIWIIFGYIYEEMRFISINNNKLSRIV